MFRNLTASMVLLAAVSIPAVGLMGCDRSKPDLKLQSEHQSQFFIGYQQFQLENGLKVLFHIDRSDPWRRYR